MIEGGGTIPVGVAGGAMRRYAPAMLRRLLGSGLRPDFAILKSARSAVPVVDSTHTCRAAVYVIFTIEPDPSRVGSGVLLGWWPLPFYLLALHPFCRCCTSSTLAVCCPSCARAAYCFYYPVG